MLEVAPGIISSAVFQLDVGPVQDNLNMTEPAFFGMIRTGVAQNVVGGR